MVSNEIAPATVQSSGNEVEARQEKTQRNSLVLVPRTAGLRAGGGTRK